MSRIRFKYLSKEIKVKRDTFITTEMSRINFKINYEKKENIIERVIVRRQVYQMSQMRLNRQTTTIRK